MRQGARGEGRGTWEAHLCTPLASRLEPNVLALPRPSSWSSPGSPATNGAGTWRIGVSVCFDNAFEDPYTRAVRAGALDFHLICSNEAWYEESFEYDQMLAFSRLIAIATGRSVVRATNAGVSAVFDPAGRELERLVVGGRDRMVSGTLRADVPVPVAAERESQTLFVRLEHAWSAAWVFLPLALFLRARRRPVTGPT